jgi:hypothetical protein
MLAVIKAGLAIDAAKPLAEWFEHTIALQDLYDLTQTHLDTMFTLGPRLLRLPAANAAIGRWLSACRGELERRTAEAPLPPRDYRRDDKLSCRCRDCRELSSFLANPDQREHRFSVAKERRRHLHSIIDGNHCDPTHETKRRGSPHTLVCTKTTGSYERARSAYERDLQNLSRLIALERKIT